MESVKIPVNVRMWRIPGCHELLASLGFNLMDVGRDEVTLKTGKKCQQEADTICTSSLSRSFDTDEAPRSLAIESSDSMEDLNEDEQTSADSPSPPPPIPSSHLCEFINSWSCSNNLFVNVRTADLVYKTL